MRADSSPSFRENPRLFGFSQWLRIWIRQKLQEPGRAMDLLSLLDEGLDIHHSGSIAFAPQDIADLRTSSQGREELRVHFMGLQGTSSPLVSYLVDPLQGSEEKWAALRGFYHIFENRVYKIYGLALLLHSPWIRCEFKSSDSLEQRLRLWAGCLETSESWAPERRLGSLSQLVPYERSLRGLHGFLTRQLGESRMEVEVTTEWIPNPSCARLGKMTLDGRCALGTEFAVGGEGIQIKMGPLAWDSYLDWARDRKASALRVATLVHDFLPRPMPWEVEVFLDATSRPKGAGRHLGDANQEDCAILGVSAWLGHEDGERAGFVLS